MKNNDLVDIVYSESIYQYVIIIKRFPNMPVVIHDNDIVNIIDILSSKYKSMLISYSLYPSKDNIFYGLELIKRDESSLIYTITGEGYLLNEESITDLERNEVINKLLELREILIDRGELHE